MKLRFTDDSSVNDGNSSGGLTAFAGTEIEHKDKNYNPQYYVHQPAAGIAAEKAKHKITSI